MLLETTTIDRYSRIHSLDTLENPLYVYGKTYERIIENLRTVTETLKKDHTLSRGVVGPMRSLYTESLFFMGDDGYYADRTGAFLMLFQSYRELALEVQRITATSHRSKVLNHNLTLSNIVIKDLVLFVERLNLERRNLSGDTDGDS